MQLGRYEVIDDWLWNIGVHCARGTDVDALVL
jgi:hypothetical protein